MWVVGGRGAQELEMEMAPPEASSLDAHEAERSASTDFDVWMEDGFQNVSLFLLCVCVCVFFQRFLCE